MVLTICDIRSNSNLPILSREEFLQAANNRFFMTVFDNIFNILQPDYPTDSILELANRLKSQHFLGFVLALYSIVSRFINNATI